MFYVIDDIYIVRAASSREAAQLLCDEFSSSNRTTSFSKCFKIQEIKPDGPALLIDIIGWEESYDGVLESFQEQQEPVFIDLEYSGVDAINQIKDEIRQLAKARTAC